MKWAYFDFTSEEDLLLVSPDGYIYQIDPKTGEFKDKGIYLGPEFTS